MPTSIPGYLTSDKAARKLGVDDSTIVRYCQQKLLRGAVNLGKQWIIPEQSVKTFVKPKRGKPAFSSR